MATMIDPTLILAGIVAVQLGIQLDCNRRVRELQRNSDLQMRWLDAISHNRPLPPAPPDVYPTRNHTRRDRRR